MIYLRIVCPVKVIAVKLGWVCLTLLIACNLEVDGTRQVVHDLKTPPIIPLNLGSGYILNTLTGDTIEPLVNSLGNEIITGRSIPAMARRVGATEMVKPQSIPVNALPDQVSNYDSRSQRAKPVLIKVDPKSLTEVPLGSGKGPSFLITSIGDTLRTGIPIATAGKIVAGVRPKPIPALALRMTATSVPAIQYLDVDQGMISSYILSMYEDRRGNLWFGTEGGGVTRYDGRMFTHFSEVGGLSNDRVWDIFEDSRGHFWFATGGGGINRYDGKTFTQFRVSSGMSNDNIWCIHEDSQGNLWFGTAGSGVSKFNGKTFTHFTEREGLSSNNITCIIEDQLGNLWLGTEGGGVNLFDGKTFRHFTTEQGLSHNTVRSLLRDQKGNLWFGTEHGVSQLIIGLDGEPESQRQNDDAIYFVQYSVKNGLSHNNVWALREDQTGAIWIGSRGGGVIRLTPPNLENVNLRDGLELEMASLNHYGVEDGLTNSSIWSILEDGSGIMWFGTNGGGINRLDRTSFVHYSEREGLENNRIWTIHEKNGSDLLFGTGGNGVSFLTRENHAFKFGRFFSKYVDHDDFNASFILSMVEATNGVLWVGTSQNGVWRLEETSMTNFKVDEGLSDNNVWAMLEDSRGHLWIGTDGGGINIYDGEGFWHFTETEGLVNDKVRCILEDRRGSIWIGTGGGLSRFDPDTSQLIRGSVTHFTEAEGLPSNVVYTLHEDRSGAIWLGTNGGGLSRFNDETFIHFSVAQGLSNNRVRSIIEDNKGHLWIGTSHGLNELSLRSNEILTNKTAYDQLYDDYQLRNYNINDGLKASDFMRNSAIFDSQYKAWWGTGKSLVMLDLKDRHTSANPPTVNLSQLDINEEFLDYNQLSHDQKKDIKFDSILTYTNVPFGLSLPHHLNHLTFHFVGIDWEAPQKIQYSYMLEGLNSKWSQMSTEAKADYRNIPFGEYVFQVKAMGDSGIWCDPIRYNFTILPPWWHSNLAYVFYSIGGLLMILLVDRFQRQRLLKKERDKAKEKELSQAKEIEKAYLDLKATQAQLIQSEKMASLGELTAGIAHEIQNPLNFVNNFSELNEELIDELIQEIKDGNLQEIGNIASNLAQNEIKIKEHGKRAEGIVKSMLQHSRISSGKKVSVNINELCEEYARLAYHGFRAKDKSFEVHYQLHLDPELPQAEVVPQDIGRVLLNLINNAFYACAAQLALQLSDEHSLNIDHPNLADLSKRENSPNQLAPKRYKPVVSISTKLSSALDFPTSAIPRRGQHILITIADNGSGIPDDMQDKIFQPFFTTKPAGSGTGLGLSISYDIVKAHGGDMKVNSQLGQGSEFTIGLPVD